MSALDTVANFVSPDTMRAVLRQTPEYVINRNRAGAILHDGFAAYDTYQAMKPALFIGSLVGAATSGWAFEKRGRKPRNTEAMVMYGAVFALCTTIAWFTRPTGDAVPEDAPPNTPPSQEGATINWLDRRVSALSDNDPGFADAAFSRLVQMPGINTTFQKMNPLIQAVVV